MVSKFNALTNAESGQGSAKNAVQAWGIIESDHVVYIAAYKELDVLGEPGAGVRLLHSLRY